MTDMKDVMDAFTDFREAHTADIKKLRDQIKEIDQSLVEANRPSMGPVNKAPAVEKWFDTKTKALVPVLESKQSLAALEPKADGAGAIPSIGRVLRGMILGSRADDAQALADERRALSIGSDPGGGYTVDGRLSSEWIDLLRSAMVLSRAGVRTVPMDTKTLTLAKLTGDPAISWHGENQTLPESEPTFGAVNLNAKTVVCLVKLSLELAQDSINIEQILQSSIITAMASAIDQAGLVGVTVDAAAAPMTGAGIVNLTGRNTVTSIGAPTSWDFLVDGMYELIVDNVPMDSIGAMIAHPALWKKMAKLKTGLTNDNTPLTASPEVERIPKLWTTAAPLTGGTTATGVIANWRDLLMGIRKSIQVQVLRETYMGSNLQLAILAYARVDFAATRPQSFCTLEGITV